MAKYIQLYKDGKEITASDGVMVVDGRLNNSSIYRMVKQRNSRMIENFPHKIADSYAVYTDRIGSKLLKINTL